MCVIIHRPAGAEIDEKHLRASWTRNPDGWGVMFVDRGQTQVWREREPKKFMDLYRQLEGLDLCIHFRKATKGQISDENLHPFPILKRAEHGQDLLLMHNGTFSDLPSINGRSDTHYLATEILRPIFAEFPKAPNNVGLQRLISTICGWSRLLTLSDDGSMWFYNKSSGVMVGDCWFSNDYSHTHLDPPKTGYYQPRTGYYGSSNSGSGKRAWDGIDGETVGTKHATIRQGWDAWDDEWDADDGNYIAGERRSSDSGFDQKGWHEFDYDELGRLLVASGPEAIDDFVFEEPDIASDFIAHLLR